MLPAKSFLRFRLAGIASLGLAVALLLPFVAHGAKTKGNVRVLGIRVSFADFNNAPNLTTIADRLQTAKFRFQRFSYEVLTIDYDTVAVTLPNNRGSYSGSSLANAAEFHAKQAGFDPDDYNIVGFYHGGHSAGSKAIVGGKRFWAAGTGGATLHEKGHNFSWGHQSRYQPSGNNPLVGSLVKPDNWYFMKNGNIDPEPYEKWKRDWITDFYDLKNDGSYTNRLWNFDQKDIDPANDKRAIRVRRTTSTNKDLWLGFRSRLLPKLNSGGDNYHLRQGVVVYWDRAEVGGSSTASLDLHPGSNAFDDQALQPGETFADTAGDVYITSLGRGGTAPNKYIDVRINRGTFPGNRKPAATWDAPSAWVAGDPLTVTVTPNDPDGDAVACMWTSSDRNIPYNTSASTFTKTWNTDGTYQLKVVVSDMKGQTKTLTKTITVTGGYPTSYWGGTTNGFWFESTNWMPAGQPNSPTAIASWSGAFVGGSQPGLGNGSTKQLRQIRIEDTLAVDVTIYMNGSLELFAGGIDMVDSTRDLTMAGSGSIVLEEVQSWETSSQAALNVAIDVDLNGNNLTLAPQGVASVSGSISGAGQLKLNGPGKLTLGGSNTYTGGTVVTNGTLDLTGSVSGLLVDIRDAGTLSGTGSVGGDTTVANTANLSPGPSGGIGTISFSGDLTLDGSLQVTVDPSASPNCDRVIVAGVLDGNTTGTNHLSSIGEPFAAGQVFPVFNTALPNGSAKTLDPAKPGPGLAWDNRLASDGSIAVIVDPFLVTFNDWVQTISGLSGTDAAFDADPNLDGVGNGLAFLLGATDATSDAIALLPKWTRKPGYLDDEGSEIPGNFLVEYRHSREAAIGINSDVLYSSDLSTWNPAVDGVDGVAIFIESDFYGPGVDRVEVSLPDSLAIDGRLFFQLTAWQ